MNDAPQSLPRSGPEAVPRVQGVVNPFAAGYTKLGLARLYRRLGADEARRHLRELRNRQRRTARQCRELSYHQLTSLWKD